MAVSEHLHSLAELLLGIELLIPLSWRVGESSVCPDKIVTGKSFALSVIESRFSSPHYWVRSQKQGQSQYAAIKVGNKIWNYTACIWSENVCLITWSIVWYLQWKCCSSFAMRWDKQAYLLPRVEFHSRGKCNFKCHNRSLNNRLRTRLFRYCRLLNNLQFITNWSPLLK
jgi:hypothetical protein